MIRNTKNEESCTINVFLKKGVAFMDCDIPEYPISENGMLVKFWNGDKIIIIPMSEVTYIEFCFDE